MGITGRAPSRRFRPVAAALVGALLVIPMILGYTAWGYYVFRGKVDASRGYH